MPPACSSVSQLGGESRGALTPGRGGGQRLGRALKQRIALGFERGQDPIGLLGVHVGAGAVSMSFMRAWTNATAASITVRQIDRDGDELE